MLSNECASSSYTKTAVGRETKVKKKNQLKITGGGVITIRRLAKNGFIDMDKVIDGIKKKSSRKKKKQKRI